MKPNLLEPPLRLYPQCLLGNGDGAAEKLFREDYLVRRLIPPALGGAPVCPPDALQKTQEAGRAPA